jgi:hypothetical protein
MILKIFSQKKIAKKLAFLTQNKAKSCKFLIITLDFEKNAIYFAENWQKSQKIVIITSTPDHNIVLVNAARFNVCIFNQLDSALECIYNGGASLNTRKRTKELTKNT